jgi:hypothetical protein
VYALHAYVRLEKLHCMSSDDSQSSVVAAGYLWWVVSVVIILFKSIRIVGGRAASIYVDLGSADYAKHVSRSGVLFL